MVINSCKSKDGLPVRDERDQLTEMKSSKAAFNIARVFGKSLEEVFMMMRCNQPAFTDL
ncbi:hypothetical protein [Oceanirhabdus sp. W0125-5]|uniref:hypothetical protein n=1 Tax=Oceanirhabdus sp. W0125-5 TaxID=2999116 RepID=UPI0022F2F900|nr:hypothetical protein [Oceanirhabdus sp. W0125-5]WBW97214.1 hypothetical protein OW730_26530 [Oceanirhabdus sp. W0125-5]